MVTFVLLVDSDCFEREKWQSQECIKSLAENTALIGYKRTLALAEVRDKLKAQGKPHAKDIAQFFASVKFADVDDAMSERVILQHLRVFSRMSDVVKLRLDQMESNFGRRHPLAHLTNIEACTLKTNAKEPVGELLLTFVVEGIFAGIIRGNVDRGCGKTALMTQVIPLLLAKRRIASYLASKFKYEDPKVDESGSQTSTLFPPERSPSKVIFLYLKFAKWHHFFWRNASFDEASSSKDRGESVAWVSDLAPSLQKIVQGLNMIYEGLADSFLLTALRGDWTASAETLLARSELVQKDVLDIDAIQTMYSEERRAACKASFHAAPEKLPEGPGFTTPEKSVVESSDSQDQEKLDTPKPEDLVARQLQEELELVATTGVDLTESDREEAGLVVELK